MANVLNKLLTICENLDTNGGSGGGSTGGGSGGSVSIDGGTHIGKLIEDLPIAGVNSNVSNKLFYILLGRYNDTVVKDLTVFFQLLDENESGEGMNMFKITTNDEFNSMIQYNLLPVSTTSSIGSVSIILCSITWEGEKYLAMKLTNSSLKTDNFISLRICVMGTDSLEKDGDEYKTIYPEKSQLSSLNEIDLSQLSQSEKLFFGSIIQGAINA